LKKTAERSKAVSNKKPRAYTFDEIHVNNPKAYSKWSPEDDEKLKGSLPVRENPGRVGACFSKIMRSDRIKISEIGVNIENHLKYSRMVIAPEPKKGIKDIGMVGIENIYVVTHQGGRCINGHDPGLMHIE